MKTYRTLLIGGVLILSAAFFAYADTPVSGTVSGIWDASGSPYLVQGDLLVPADSSLIINPGVWVIFEGEYEFVVDGIVEANGLELDSIYFTTNPGITWSGFEYINNPDTSRFYYCLFEYADNYPNGYGGVFYLYRSDMIVEHCTFRHNKANRGAAMYALWNYVSFRYNVCWDNEVSHCGGALNFATYENTIIERCLFYDNYAGKNPGGAIYFWDDHCQVINCTIVQNTQPAIFSINGSTSPFVNCIFWYNEMGDVPAATYCDVQYGWPGVGNINEDPLFVDPIYFNFHLSPNSPCIDAGDPSLPLDPDSTIADIGAYYFDQSGPGFNLTLDLEPVNPPIILPPQGGLFEYTATATCDPTGSATFDAWTELLLPDGQVMGPLFIRQELFLAAGASLLKELEMYVSAWAMPGVYEFRGYLGECPDTTYASDYFTFEKESMSGMAPGGSAYAILSGWDGDETIHLPAAKFPVSDNLELSSSPNPFNPETSLRFYLPASGHADLRIYDLAGRTVMTLLDRNLEAGWHSAGFNGSHLASGVYLAVLEWSKQRAVERLLLVK